MSGESRRLADSPSPLAAGYRVLACQDCGALDPGGRRYCARCGADALVPTPVGGRGTLVSWTFIRRPPEGVDADGPYAVALVDLEEGVRISARVSNAQSQNAKAELVLGSPVEIVGRTGDVPIIELSKTEADKP